MPSLKHLAPVVAAAFLVAAVSPAQAVDPGTHTDPRGDVESFGYVPVHTAAKKKVVSSIDLTRAHVLFTRRDIVYRIHFAPALARARSTGATVELWLLFDQEKPEGELAATKQINFAHGRVSTLGPRYITTRWNPTKHLAVFRVPLTRLKNYRVDLQSGAVWKRAEYADTMSFGREKRPESGS